MQSTLKVKATDPHDLPAIAPDVIPATWADKVLADITRDARTIQPESLRRDGQPHAPSSAVAVAAPTVDTTFRATEVGDARPGRAKRPRSKWAGQIIMVFTFALVSAFAAGLWRHYGDPAREIIAEWTPLIAQWTPQFAAASSPPDQAAPAEQAAAPAEQTASGDQPAATPDSTTAAAAPAAIAPPSESAELIQSMQRDLAAMGQQIEQLKASIAELKAGQPPVPAVARTTEAKPAEVKPPAPAARPRVSAVQSQPPAPPRPAPPPVRRPPPVQASAAPMQLAAPPPPPPPQARADDGEPVVRPPMPLRWGSVNE